MTYRQLALAAALVAAPAAAQEASTEVSPAATPAPLAPAITPVVTTTAPAPLVVAPPPGGNAVLRTGTELSLTLLQELTTRGKRLHGGDRVRLEVAEPVLVNGVTVIPQGSPVAAEIIEVRNKGMWGRSGRFVARLLNVNVNGRQIRLGGTFDDKGKAGGWGAAAVSAIVFLPAGFFMTGTSAFLPAGTTVRGFIDEDVPLALPATPVSAVLTIAPATPLQPAPVSAPPFEPVPANTVAEAATQPAG